FDLRDPVERLIGHHARFYLADQTLVAMDRASMAAGLEVRAPFLDPALVELAATVPSGLKLRRWTTKYVLRRPLAERLPPMAVRRRRGGVRGAARFSSRPPRALDERRGQIPDDGPGHPDERPLAPARAFRCPHAQQAALARMAHRDRGVADGGGVAAHRCRSF